MVKKIKFGVSVLNNGGNLYIKLSGLKNLFEMQKLNLVMMLDKICVFMVMLCSGLKMNDNVINIIIVIEIG